MPSCPPSIPSPFPGAPGVGSPSTRAAPIPGPLTSQLKYHPAQARIIRIVRRFIIDSRQLAASAAHLAEEKKATDILVFDVDKQLQVADYFVVISGQNRTHVRAIVNDLHVRLKSAGEQHQPMEGVQLGWWVVLDYGDVVVHILQPEAREYYDLERLYGDCPQLEWQSVEIPEIPEYPDYEYPEEKAPAV